MGAARPSHLPSALSVAVALLAASVPACVMAQEVRGRVSVEGTGGEPVEGALVALVSADERAADADFTDGAGRFLLRSAAPGDYRVRVDRIGFESWTSEALTLAAGELRALDIALPIRPVRLARIDVSVRRQCFDDRRRAPQIEVVWEEARKALAAAELAQRKELFRFNSIVFNRLVTSGRMDLVAVSTTSVDDVVEAPFRSLAADSLSSFGWIQEEPDSTIYYYAPDARVLLSDTFLGDHCFGLRREREDDRTLVGLSFEPREDRELPDISGVLWLDETSAALERVEFRYESIPYRGVDDDRIAGRIDFARIPSGAFVVRDWFIRMPVLMKEEGRERYRLYAFTEYGGELRDVLEPAGAPVAWRQGASIRGHISNPLTGAPLADATVTLDRPRGRDVERHAGPDGTFVFDGLEAGKHKLDYRHPVFEAIRWRPREEELTLAAGETREISFAIPGAEQILRDQCGRDAAGTGVILGQVRDRALRYPYSRVRVWAQWFEPRGVAEAGDEVQELIVSDIERTDATGHYKLCGIPLGTEIVVRTQGPRDERDSVRRTLDRPVLLLDFERGGR